MAVRVLVVEDEPAVQELVGAYLKGRGFAAQVMESRGSASGGVRGRAPTLPS